MKKIALLLMLAIGMIACQKEEILELSEPDQKLVLPAEGGSTSMRFTSSTNWTAEIKDADWCTVTPASGTPGSMLIEVTGKANKGEETREAKLVISSETLMKEVTLTQEPSGTVSMDNEKNFVVPLWGGEVKLTINHNIPYDLILPDWIEIAGTKSTMTDEVILNVKPQPIEGAERRANVIINTEAGNMEVVVKQEKWIPTFIILDEKLEIPNEGGDATFTLLASMEPELLPSENNWLEISQEGTTVKCTAKDPNHEWKSREVILTIQAKDEKYREKTTKKLTIAQVGAAVEVKWHHYLTKVKDFNTGLNSAVVRYKDYVLLANEDKIIVTNAADGKYAQTISLPQGYNVSNMLTDDGGNIIVCTGANGANDLTVFKVTDINNLQVEPLTSFNGKSLYAVQNTGNIRIVGDINKEAVLTCVSSIYGGKLYVNACEITNGTAGAWKSINANTVSTNNYWGHDCGVAIANGTRIADGIYTICYNKPYNLNLWNQDTDAWAEVFVTGAGGADNFHGLSIAEFHGKKFLAVLVGAHFDNTNARAMLLDITDPAKIVKAYNIEEKQFVNMGTDGKNQDWTFGARSSDIHLNVTGDAMNMYIIDNRFNTFIDVEFK